jgi:hypothetical protein
VIAMAALRSLRENRPVRVSEDAPDAQASGKQDAH